MFLNMSNFLPHFAGLKPQLERLQFHYALQELIGSWGGALCQGWWRENNVIQGPWERAVATGIIVKVRKTTRGSQNCLFLREYGRSNSVCEPDFQDLMTAEVKNVCPY